MTDAVTGMNDDAARALDEVLAAAGLQGLDRAALTVSGTDPIVPSRFRLGAAVAGALGAQALGIAQIWQQRGGRPQQLVIDLAHAAYPGLCTFLHIQQNGHALPFTRWDGQGPNFFPTRDGRRFYLLYTANYVQHCLRLHAFLGASTHHVSVARAIAGWDGEALEQALAEQRLIGAVARTRQQWLAHPQGAWLADQGPLTLERIGSSPPEPFGPAERPLAGVRVLDMAHVLAGPVASRVLAEQGADVIHVSAAHQPDGHLTDIDTGLGKRTAFIDLERADDRERLRTLIRGADVFIQSWRPGALGRRGFSPEAIAALRPGIVQASLSCYGSGGPWGERGGYEPLGQAVSGYAIAEGSTDEPRLACTFTLNDYLAAYLAAAGIVGALLRRAAQGGSHHVQTSLTQSSMWVQSLGALPRHLWPDGEQGVAALPDAPARFFQQTASVFGTLRHPRPIVHYGETPAYWALPPSPMGAGLPHWLP
ncbi:MAG TPA: CoA transferase [Rubrivivax sp.]|nr:CoA transferase [Rubrivivax sp.]